MAAAALTKNEREMYPGKELGKERATFPEGGEKVHK